MRASTRSTVLGRRANAIRRQVSAQLVARDYESCVQLINEIVEIGQATAGDYFALGSSWRSLNNIHKAIEGYTNAISIDPYPYEYYSFRGGQYTRFGTEEGYRLAIADFTIAITLTDRVDKQSLLYYRRARYLARLGDYHDAIKDYCCCIDLNPSFKKAYAGRGLLRGLRNQFSLASADFTTAFEDLHLESRFLVQKFVFSDRALWRLRTGDFSGSSDDFLVVLDCCRGEGGHRDSYWECRVLWRRCFALCHLDQFSEARESLIESYEISSSSNGDIDSFVDLQETLELVPSLAFDYERFFPVLCSERSRESCLALRSLLRATDSISERVEWLLPRLLFQEEEGDGGTTEVVVGGGRERMKCWRSILVKG